MSQSTALPPRAGVVRIEGDRGSLHFSRRLQHPPERVWAALTENEQLREWFLAADAKIDGRPGGTYEVIAGPSRFHVTGRILTWDPPRVFEYEWNVAPRDEMPSGETTIVRWELEPADGGTILTFSQSGLTRRTAIGFGPGMHAFLDRLEAHLNGAPLPNWMERMREAQAGGGYPAWQA